MAESDGLKRASVTVQSWQENILRRHHRSHTQRQLGFLCGRSRQWAQAALQLLQLTTPLQDARRAAKDLPK